jgi:hypothetical protein
MTSHSILGRRRDLDVQRLDPVVCACDAPLGGRMAKLVIA